MPQAGLGWRVVLGISLAIGAAAAGPAAADYLTDGTKVPLVLEDRVKSGADKKGDRVDFTVAQDVLGPEGRVLIKKGTPALGQILNSRKAGFIGRQGRVAFSIDLTTTVDGQKVPLRAEESKSGRAHKAGTIAAAVILTPAALLVTGKNATFKPGTEVTAYVDQTLTVKPDR